MSFQRGDVIVIYRTGDGQGPAEYRAVATSLCVVEDVHTIDKYHSEADFIKECVKFSVFSEAELRTIYRERRYTYIVNFTYNVALPKRLTRQQLADDVGLNRDIRWGCIELLDEPFQKLIKLSKVAPKFIRS